VAVLIGNTCSSSNQYFDENNFHVEYGVDSTLHHEIHSVIQS
jgi:hypothetical protein